MNKSLFIITIGIIKIVLILLIIAALFMLDQQKTVSKELGSSLTYTDREYTETVWEDVNVWKKYNAGYQYTPSPALCETAQIRAQEIHSDWSHKGFSIIRFDQLPFTHIGENLSRRFDSPDEVITGWLNSEKHLDLLEEKYTHACVICIDKFCALHLGGNL